MHKTTGNESSSSADSERLTIAYTESMAGAEYDSQEVSDKSSISFSTTTSSSLETPTSQESVTSQFAVLDHMREMQLHFGYEPVWRTMSTIEGPKLRALDYLWERSVFQLFSFLTSHLLAYTPEDPVSFLMTLVERCIRYRDHNDEPPLLFQDSHVNSVYTALDPMGDGSITYSQYLAGMNTLGVTDFNLMPNDGESYIRSISRNAFLSEAKLALMNQLDQLLGKLEGICSIQTEKQVSVSNNHIEEYNSHQTTKDSSSVVVSKEKSSSDKTYIVP